MTAKTKELKQTNIRLDPDIWKQAKVKAAEKGMSLQDFVNNALEKAVNSA
jgi:predicted HicB family RNase H-like nuclease